MHRALPNATLYHPYRGGQTTLKGLNVKAQGITLCLPICYKKSPPKYIGRLVYKLLCSLL